MTDLFDVIIIGGGVVGCSVVFELTNLGYRCVLLEGREHLVSEASAGNSGMLHTGFDAPPGSVELECIQRCQARIFDVLDKLGLPYIKCGATMVAWSQSELSCLPSVLRKAQDTGVTDVYSLSLSELYQRETNLGSGANGAIWIPGETILDPWLTPVGFAHHAKLRGARVLTNALVRNVNWGSDGTWTVDTDLGSFRSKSVINCSGLYGDIVDKLAGAQFFKIKPRKGQFLVYSKQPKPLLNSSILTVPTEKTKGILLFKSAYDNIVVGPTAEDVDSREPAPIDPSITTRLTSWGSKILPCLRSGSVVRMYTGVRPATESKDYHIRALQDRNWLTVGGIRSTGVSACLGIAEMVSDMLKDKLYMEPSGTQNHNLRPVTYTFMDSHTAVIDGLAYAVTHPLTQTGHERPTSHL